MQSSKVAQDTNKRFHPNTFGDQVHLLNGTGNTGPPVGQFGKKTT